MEFAAIVAKLKERWPEADAPKVEAGDPFVVIPAAGNVEILTALRDDPDLAFDSLMTLHGVDTGKEMWVVYALHSFKRLHKLTVKAILPREAPAVDSVHGLWAIAEFFEREAYDIYGIVFRNHPDLRRILNPPDWVGWPGRKDYAYPTEYRGVPTGRKDQFFAEDIAKAIAEREAKEKEAAAKPAAEAPKPAGPASSS